MCVWVRGEWSFVDGRQEWQTPNRRVEKGESENMR